MPRPSPVLLPRWRPAREERTTRHDIYLGHVKAPEIEPNPIDGTIDLVWVVGSGRTIVSLRDAKELRLLVQRAIEAVASDRDRFAQEAGA